MHGSIALISTSPGTKSTSTRRVSIIAHGALLAKTALCNDRLEDDAKGFDLCRSSNHAVDV